MNLTFHGAARQVTGSMCLLELENGYKILIDCGTDFEDRSIGNSFPFNPADIDLVLLTHAHLDHSGNIPNLYIQGYTGQVLCTSPTYELTKLILNDAATIQSKNLKRKLKRKQFNGRKIEDEGYLETQVEKAADRFVAIAFNKAFEINEYISLKFIPAGHLLGAAHILLDITENGASKKILFSGDIGRKNYPLLEDPQLAEQVDYVICESTYGDRLHIETENPEDLLLNIINSSCIEKPGRLIIPSFSIGRTQALLYTLNKLVAQNRMPMVKVFADSPMAESCTRIYEKFVGQLNREAQSFYEDQTSLFDFENLIPIKNHKESKLVSSYHEPCIILSSSGMISGGRIQEHIKKNLGNQYCTILLVGYCAEGTSGYSLFNGAKCISIKGRNIPVQAQIINTDVFSGHGDQTDLISFIKNQDTKKTKKIFLVHGEYYGMQTLKNKFEEIGHQNIEIPYRGQVYEL